MSVDKFKFAGPSIQVAEIDESRVEQPVAGIGPVVIGRTARGPAMAPVTVSTQAELERVFGAAYNGKSAANDVWRNGNQLAPTYATYAAKAFLQNSAPVTVIRTLGTHDEGDTTLPESAKAGWAISDLSSRAKAMGLFLFNSGSGVISGSLVAVLYGIPGTAEDYPAYVSGSGGWDNTTDNLQKLTTGRAKANVRNVKVKDFGINITKGKNKDWAKNANKTTLPSAAKSRRASLKEANLNSRLEKHPLVRNAGNASSETKYRVMRGKPVPVKKKTK
jgi:hypothetical protein